jgi:hypothetical protein
MLNFTDVLLGLVSLGIKLDEGNFIGHRLDYRIYHEIDYEIGLICNVLRGNYIAFQGILCLDQKMSLNK